MRGNRCGRGLCRGLALRMSEDEQFQFVAQ